MPQEGVLARATDQGMSGTHVRARLAVVGPMVDNDLVFAEYLARHGHEVTVLRRKSAKEGEQFGSGGFSRFTDTDVVEYSSPLELVSKVRGFDYVFTFTGSYPFGLFYLLPFYPVLTRLARWSSA